VHGLGRGAGDLVERWEHPDPEQYFSDSIDLDHGAITLGSIVEFDQPRSSAACAVEVRGTDTVRALLTSIEATGGEGSVEVSGVVAAISSAMDADPAPAAAVPAALPSATPSATPPSSPLPARGATASPSP